MRSPLALLLLCLCLLPASGQHNRLTDEERAEGWELLFDGAGTDNWTGGIGIPFPTHAWRVEDESLALYAPPSFGSGSLYSREEFRDFDFRFEWRISPEGNSGVKYLAAEGHLQPDNHKILHSMLAIATAAFLALAILALLALRRVGPFRREMRRTAVLAVCALGTAALGWHGLTIYGYYRSLVAQPAGFEYQMTDDTGNDYAVAHERGRTAALYDLIAPEGAVMKPVGEFNQSRIVVEGDRVEHWLNGVKVLEYRLGSDDLRGRIANSKFRGINGYSEKRSGRFELQNHGDRVWIRNLKIRRLSPTP